MSMILQIPWKIELPDSIYIGNEQLPAEVHTTPYGGLADVVTYESENGRDHIDVTFAEQKVYVRYNGQSDTFYFERIEDLVEYLMRSCEIGKSTKKSKSTPQSFSDMVQKQRNKNIQKFNKEDGSFDENELQTIWSGLDDMEHAYFKVDDVLCPNTDVKINEIMNRIWESYHELRSYLTEVL